MLALIEPSGRVAQVVPDNGSFPVAPPLTWVSAPATVTPEWTYDGTKFSPPVVPPIDPAKLPPIAADVIEALKTVLASSGVTPTQIDAAVNTAKQQRLSQ